MQAIEEVMLLKKQLRAMTEVAIESIQDIMDGCTKQTARKFVMREFKEKMASGRSLPKMPD